MQIPQNFIEELTARADIFDVVSKYVKLNRKGHLYFGICPFHNEKTASFTVTPDKQIFHCFGCSAGGGAITFIMRIEGLSFVDAVIFLADMYNMKVPEQHNVSPKRDRLLLLNKKAARFFYDTLYSSKGAHALSYFKRRNLHKRTMDNFGLGYSEDSWDALLKHLNSEGFKTEEIFEAGLVIKGKNGSHYDRFRGRAMFPIIDIRGNILGFGGRVLDDSLPKYINSPEGIVYSKGRHLYGLNRARKTKFDYFILTEGYMDVLSLHAVGFDNAIASLGTALTDEQAKLISRQKNKIYICYDADAAGQKATARAIEILSKTDMDVRVLLIPGAKDPDEFIKEFGVSAFENMIEGSQNHMEYKLLSVKAKYNLENSDEKVSYLKECADIICKLDSAISREVYSSRVSQIADISLSAMEIEVKNAFKAKMRKTAATEKRKILSPAQNIASLKGELKYTNVKCARAEEGLISLIFSDSTLLEEISAKINPNEFSSPFLAKIYEYAKEIYQNNDSLSISAFEQHLSPQELNLLISILSQEVKGSSLALNDYINTIKQYVFIQNSDLEKIAQLKRDGKGCGRNGYDGKFGSSEASN